MRKATMENFESWLKEISIAGNEKPFVEHVQGHGGPDNKETTVRIYTEKHRYQIKANWREKDNGYLGCTVSNRILEVGEDWTRGRDLPDGPLERQTWSRIKNAIISHEIKPLRVQSILKVAEK